MSPELTVCPPVAPEHDRIRSISDEPLWAENLVFQVNDPAAGVAIWCHWGRMPGHPEIWEGVIALYLGGGELLVSRSFGRSPREQAAASGPLAFDCVEPGRSWSLGFDGMALTTTSAAVFAAPLADGAVERLSVELAFEGITPLWSAHGAMGEQSWAHAHLEQAGRVTGTASFRDRTVTIDAFGFRDHSYGPRDYSRLLGDTWITAVFPSGRAFLTIDVWQLDGPALQRGFVWDGETLSDAVGIDVPRLADAVGAPQAFEHRFITPDGAQSVSVRKGDVMVWAMATPSALVPRIALDDPRIRATEAPATISWDGEVAAGWAEMSLRPPFVAGG